MKKQLVLFLLLLFLILVVSCASTKKNQVVINDNKQIIELPVIPPGVDSSLALQWREKAKKLFTSAEAKQTAKSIYNNASLYIDIVDTLYSKIRMKKDSLKMLRSRLANFKRMLKKKKASRLEDKKKVSILEEKVVQDSTTIDIVFSLLEYFLFDARDSLDLAYSYDPFNLDILQRTGEGEYNRGRMYRNKDAFESALNYFFRYLKFDKSNFWIYNDISLTYYEMENWKESLNYAQQAVDTYEIIAYFDKTENDNAKDDSVSGIPHYFNRKIYFSLLYLKGLAEIKQMDGDAAFETFSLAMRVADNETDKLAAEDALKNYVLWDDRNIASAVKYWEIQDSMRVGNYEWAFEAFKELKPKLRSKRAKHEVAYNMSKLAWNYLQKLEEAIELLYPVVAELDSNPNTKNIFELPADTTGQRYFIDCGKMLLDLGRKYRGLGEREKARKYLAMDTTIVWKGRAKAFMLLEPYIAKEITGRERMKQFYEGRLKFLRRAYSLKENLETKEIDQLYKDLIQTYQRMNDRKNQQYYYREWQQWKKSVLSKS